MKSAPTRPTAPAAPPAPSSGRSLNPTGEGGGLLNNVLTASRMVCTMTCLRKSFWAYELGLRKHQQSYALRFGSAWARAMDFRWRGAAYEEALAVLAPEGTEFDAYQYETLCALLAGYYDTYGDTEAAGYLHPEVEFEVPLEDGFVARGKMDVLGQLASGETAIVEGKTTGDSLADGSDYWLRLAFNMQLFNYVTGARHHGWDPARVFYDVTRKPSIKPKVVADLDGAGKKIVVDARGDRQFMVAGKSKGLARQTADAAKGWALREHVESPGEFSDRLWRDTAARPEFYFARREVPIIDYQVAMFERQRRAIGRLIISLRESEDMAMAVDGVRDPEAWPRNVSKDTCNFCQFKDFCLQNITPEPGKAPSGFEYGPFNPELEKDYEHDTSAETTATT